MHPEPNKPEHVSPPNPFDLAAVLGPGFASLGGAPDAPPDLGLPPDPGVFERNLIGLCARNRALVSSLIRAFSSSV